MVKFIKIGSVVLLTLYFSLFFFQKINLTTADLGRHITNGKLFFEKGTVVSGNYYSYTQPDFEVVNHHWFSGVIFFVVEKLGGFNMLSIFYALICGATVYVFFKNASYISSPKIALLITLLALPLMVNRKEIRPEGFSYLFLGLYFLLFQKFKQHEITFKKLLAIIIPAQIMWVNTHIFFIMGIFVAGTFLVQEFIISYFYKKKSKFKNFFYLCVILSVVSIINPYGFWGLLEPLNIFKEYGYTIIENQPVLFIQKMFPRFIYFHFEILAVVFIFSAMHMIFSKKAKNFTAVILLTLLYMVYSFKAIRGIPMFGMFFTIFFASYLKTFYNIKEAKLMALSFVFIVLSFIPNQYLSFINPIFGTGLLKNINASANFFKENDVKGPIFNNYDIGGYLIYHLHEREKVFVDNRPEAYSTEFLQGTYVSMQESEELWQQKLKEYNFNSIYFYRRDYTPWAQPFLIKRVQDESWAPVFVDDYVLIMLRDNEQNKEIIERFRLPDSLFSFTRT